MHDQSDNRRLPRQRTTTDIDPRTAALAAMVQRRRLDLGLRQIELAELAGCSERFVHTLEHGKPGLQLGKVLDVLRVLGLGLDVGPGRGTTTATAS